MATATKRCKVCGCEYEYCHTAKRVAGVFRWQDVACSPEHGSEYLSLIRTSRNQSENNVIESNEVLEDNAIETYLYLANEYEEDDENDEDEFYNEDEECDEE